MDSLTYRKIDFFGGAHGNFLELVINHAIDQNSYDISKMQFNEQGACHNKDYNDSYVPITTSRHYSHNGYQFQDNDWVIRITPTQSDLLILVTNSYLRAGNQPLDIMNLQHDTFAKMSRFPKLDMFLKTLISNHGVASSYPRQILRHYFESMFAVPECGLELFTNWMPAKHQHTFNFSSFFSIGSFFKELQEISKFVNLKFYPSQQLIELYDMFLEKNQGWHSHLKCNKIIDAIVRKKSMSIENLNIVEEAWISYQISQIFNLYDLPCCRQEYFPVDTLEITDEIEKHF